MTTADPTHRAEDSCDTTAIRSPRNAEAAVVGERKAASAAESCSIRRQRSPSSTNTCTRPPPPASPRRPAWQRLPSHMPEQVDAAVSTHAGQPFHALVRRGEREVQRAASRSGAKSRGEFVHLRLKPGAGRPDCLNQHVIGAVDTVVRDVLVVESAGRIEHRVSGSARLQGGIDPGDEGGVVEDHPEHAPSMATTPLASNRRMPGSEVASRSWTLASRTDAQRTGVRALRSSGTTAAY